MVHRSQKASKSEDEIERRVRARLQIERERDKKETDDKLKEQADQMASMKAQMGDMYKQFQQQLQVMQTIHQGQIANLQSNMNGFNSFQHFMTAGSSDFTPTNNLGCGSTLLPIANKVSTYVIFITYINTRMLF